MRLLAIKVGIAGLFDTNCIRLQRRENELADQREKAKFDEQQKEMADREAAWKKEHPRYHGPPPIFIPLPPLPVMDPGFSSFTVEGIASVTEGSVTSNHKPDSLCMTPEAQSLQALILRL